MHVFWSVMSWMQKLFIRACSERNRSLIYLLLYLWIHPLKQIIEKRTTEMRFSQGLVLHRTGAGAAGNLVRNKALGVDVIHSEWLHRAMRADKESVVEKKLTMSRKTNNLLLDIWIRIRCIFFTPMFPFNTGSLLQTHWNIKTYSFVFPVHWGYLSERPIMHICCEFRIWWPNFYVSRGIATVWR